MWNHDDEVREEAFETILDPTETLVAADVEGFDQPEPVNGRRPDIVKQELENQSRTLVEIEGRDSVGSQHSQDQLDAFVDSGLETELKVFDDDSTSLF